MTNDRLTEILTRFEFANKESWTKRYDPAQGCQVTGDYILLQMAKNELPQVTRELMTAEKLRNKYIEEAEEWVNSLDLKTLE